MSAVVQEQPNKGIPDEVKKLLQQVIGTKQTIIYASLSRIFTARSEGDWTYSNLQGILCVVWDREKENTPFLRLFDIESFDLLFEAEMYIDFHLSYVALTPNFYFFEYMSAFIGLQFACEKEAYQFALKIMSQSLKSKQMEEEQPKVEKKKEEKEGLFGFRQGAKKMFNNLFKKDKRKSVDAGEEFDISKPISVQKVTSLQFDTKTNQFDFSNLNEEWKSIFQRAGIQPSDLQSEQLAPIIFESVIRFQSHYESQIGKQSQDPSNKTKVKQPDTHTNTIQEKNKGSGNQTQSIPEAPQININIPIAPPLNTNVPVAPPLNFNNIPPAPPINTAIPIAPPIGNLSDQKSTINLVPKNNAFDSSQVMNKSSLLDQIKNGNFQLKRVEVNPKDNKANLDVTGMNNQDQENLSMYLSKCIAERRKQIKKHQYSSSEESSNSEDDD